MYPFIVPMFLIFSIIVFTLDPIEHIILKRNTATGRASK